MVELENTMFSLASRHGRVACPLLHGDAKESMACIAVIVRGWGAGEQLAASHGQREQNILELHSTVEGRWAVTAKKYVSHDLRR